MKIKDVIVEDAEEIRAAVIDKVNKIPDEADLRDVLKFTNKFAFKKDVQAFAKVRNYKDLISDTFLTALANAEIDSDTVNKFLTKLNSDGILNEKLLLTPGKVHRFSQLIDPEWQSVWNQIKGELFEKLAGTIGDLGYVGKGEYLLDIVSQKVKRRGAPGDLDVDGTKVEIKAGKNGRLGPAGSQPLVGRFPEFLNKVKHLVSEEKLAQIPEDGSTELGMMFNIKENMSGFSRFFENPKAVKFALNKALSMHFPNYATQSIANQVVDGSGNIDGTKLKQEMLRAAFSSYKAAKSFDGVIVMDESVTKFLYIGSEDDIATAAPFLSVSYPSWVEQQGNCIKVTLTMSSGKISAPDVQLPLNVPGQKDDASQNFENQIEEFIKLLAAEYNITDPATIGAMTTITMDAYMQGIEPKQIINLLRKEFPQLNAPKKPKTQAAAETPAEPDPAVDTNELDKIKKNAGITTPTKPTKPGVATV